MRVLAHDRVVLSVLALDVVLAWLAAAGAVIFVERTWLLLGGYAIQEMSLAEHARQFTWLRRVQLVALSFTVLALVAWIRRAGPLSPAAPRLLLGWWWAAIGAAAAADGAVRIRSAVGPSPLEPGGPLPLLLLGEILKIAAAVLTIVGVSRVGAARRL